MTIGFTGTQQGMRPHQRMGVATLMHDLRIVEFHHGDCVGSDLQAHTIAVKFKVITVVHPPTDSVKRAFCQARPGFVYVLDPKPYLVRNKDIVKAGVDGLIAAPKDFVQPASLRGQGTWTTIGYARKAGRRIWIVLPDGRVVEEPARG